MINKDISGTLDGAAGIGDLLHVKVNGAIFVPHYDAYGNVTGYRDTEGNVVAEYVYDAGLKSGALGRFCAIIRT